jgi:hypothetical protein
MRRSEVFPFFQDFENEKRGEERENKEVFKKRTQREEERWGRSMKDRD